MYMYMYMYMYIYMCVCERLYLVSRSPVHAAGLVLNRGGRCFCNMRLASETTERCRPEDKPEAGDPSQGTLKTGFAYLKWGTL